jgi:hypothetical protein
LVNGVTIGTGNQFTVTIDPDTSNEEIVFITQQSSDTFTITRARAGSSPVSHSAGATVRHVLTSDDLNYFNGAVPSAIVDAKGDLIVATAPDVVSRLAVGTNDQVLTADSATATGLKWGAVGPLTTKGDVFTYSTANARLTVGANNTKLVADSAATTGLKWVGFQGVSCKKSASQSLNNGTTTALTFDTEDFDTDAFHNNVTDNSRITIPTGMAGKYEFKASIEFAPDANGYRRFIFKKNNSSEYRMNAFQAAPGTLQTSVLSGSIILDLIVGDYVEVVAWQGSGVSLDVTPNTYFQAQYLGA